MRTEIIQRIPGFPATFVLLRIHRQHEAATQIARRDNHARHNHRLAHGRKERRLDRLLPRDGVAVWILLQDD